MLVRRQGTEETLHSIAMRFRRCERRLLLLFSITIGACVTFAAVCDGVRVSAVNAESQTVRSLNAGFDYSVSVPQSAPSYRTFIDQDVPRLRTADGAFRTPDARARAPVVTSTTDVVNDYGVTVASRQAGAGIALSTALADALGVSIGDDVELDISSDDVFSTTVTRIFVMPSTPTLQVAAIRADVRTGSDRWLLSEAALNSEEFRPFLEDGSSGISVASVGGVVAERTEYLDSGPLAPLRYVGPGVLVLGLLMWTILVGAARSRWRSHVEGLSALGLSQVQIIRMLATSVDRMAALGVIAGVAIGWGISAAGYAIIDAVVGHAWTRPSISILRTLLLAVALVMLAAVVSRLGLRGESRVRAPLAFDRPLAWASIAAAVGGALFLLLAYVERHTQNVMALLVIGGTLFAGGAPGAALHLGIARARRRATLVRTMRQNAGLVVAGGMIVTIVTYPVMFVSATAHATAQVGRASFISSQPADSIVLSEADAATVALVRDLAVSRLGVDRTTTIVLPDETNVQVRVSSPSYARCVRELTGLNYQSQAQAECPLPVKSMVPVNVVGMSSDQQGSSIDPKPGEVIADASLMESGEIGFVILDDNSVVLGAQTYPAIPSTSLGGNLPGAVLGTRVAQDLGVTTGPGQRLLIPDASVGGIDQGPSLVASILAIAPTSQIIYENGFDDRGLGAWSIMIAILGATLTALLVHVVTAVASQSAAPTRLMVRILGATRATQRQLEIVMFVALPAALTLCAIGTAVSVRLWGGPGAWPGVAFALPAALGLVVWSLVRPRPSV